MIDVLERVDTFKIDAELREHWLTALRSPEWVGHETYMTLADQGNYCALGLLAHIEGQPTKHDYSWFWEQHLPTEQIWATFDGNRMTFAQFADWLEAHSEPVQ